jgi:hypothetical protein
VKHAHSTTGKLLLLLGLLTVAACSVPAPDPQDPASVALQLFALSESDPGAEELRAWFDPDLLTDQNVALLDALDGISESAAPNLLGVESEPNSQEAFVDLEIELRGAGRAVYNVKVRRIGEDGWRIAWFQGPGVEWPSRNRKGAGLTTSAPPEPPSED